MKKYPIYSGNKIVGGAEVDKQGMFYVIRCRCDLPKEQLYKVFVTSKDNTYDLGICTKSDKGIGMVTRLGANMLIGTELHFTVEPESFVNRKMYAVSDNSEFPDLDIILNAKFYRRDGKAYICPD